jgi:hypothetical protein
MIEINFYQLYKTDWQELQKMAIDLLQAVEVEQMFEDDEEVNDVEIGDLPESQINSDYMSACKSGLKTFIFDVLNEWGLMNIIYVDDKFYKKINTIELEGNFKNLNTNIFKNSGELLNHFKLELVKLTTDEYDILMDNFDGDVVASVYSYEIKYIDTYDDDDDDDDDL